MGTAVMDKLRFARELQSRKETYYRIAYSYVKNEHDALDIVGEAAYKGLRTLGTLREADYFDTWMTRIVINAAIDFTRSRSRVTLCEEPVLEVLAAPEEELTPEDSMDLYKALDALSEKDRICVTLRYFEEQPSFKSRRFCRSRRPPSSPGSIGPWGKCAVFWRKERVNREHWKSTV